MPLWCVVAETNPLSLQLGDPGPSICVAEIINMYSCGGAVLPTNLLDQSSSGVSEKALFYDRQLYGESYWLVLFGF